METTASELRRDLAAVRERLLAAIAGVSEEQFKRRPPGGNAEASWSIAEVLAHLLASERLRAERIQVALREPDAPIEPSSPAAHEAAARAGRLAPVPQLVHGLLASRREVEMLLDEAESLADGGERAVLHPRLGRQTVAWMVREKIIAHEREHAAQIEALRAVVVARPPGGPA